MRKIKFTKDFAGRKKDEEIQVDGLLASQLVRGDKVAKFTDEAERKAAAEKADKEREANKKKAKAELNARLKKEREAQKKAKAEAKRTELKNKLRKEKRAEFEKLLDEAVEEELAKSK